MMLTKLFWLIIGLLLSLIRFDCNGYYYKTKIPYEIPQRMYYQFWPKLQSINNKDYKVYENQMDDYEMMSHFQKVANFNKQKPLQFTKTPTFYKFLQQNPNRPTYQFPKMTNLWTNKPIINQNYYKDFTTPVNFKYTRIPETDTYSFPIKHQQLTNFKDNSYNFEDVKEISPSSISWNNQLENNYQINPEGTSNFDTSNYKPAYDFNQNNYANKDIVYDNNNYNNEHITTEPIIDQNIVVDNNSGKISNYDYNINPTNVPTTANPPDKIQNYHYFPNDQSFVKINSNNNVNSKITETIKPQQPAINQDLNANFEDKDNKATNVDYNQPLKTGILPDYRKKPIEISNLKTNNQFKTTKYTLMFNNNDIKSTEMSKTKPKINQNILDADIKDDNIETYVYSKFEPMRLTKKKKVNFKDIQRRTSIKRQIPTDYIIYITERILD